MKRAEPGRTRAAAAGSRRRLLKAACGVAAGGLAGATAPRPAGAAAAPTTRPALRRGLNLSRWFEYDQDQDVSAAEMAGLHALGLDHVRIPVDPVIGDWRPEAGATRLSFMPALRRAIEQAFTAGLDVVVDVHATADTQQAIEERPVLDQALVSLWTQIGRALGDLSPAHLAFELYNEPQYHGAAGSRWPALQDRLLAALRGQAPHHLALLSGNQGGSLKGLLALPPVADPAVAYVFHYYEPLLFTHQGASWLDTRHTTAGLRSGLRYPVAAQGKVEPGLSEPHPRAAAELAAYRDTNWGPARVRADLDAAGAHARRLGLRLLCSEFGAIRDGVEPESRWRWMTDVRTALEANGIGWTLWDYSDIFGITTPVSERERSGPRQIEAGALKALGLPVAGASAR